MLSTSIFAAIDGTNQTYTNFKLKIEPSVFSLKFVDVCPRSCDLLSSTGRACDHFQHVTF